MREEECSCDFSGMGQPTTLGATYQSKDTPCGEDEREDEVRAGSEIRRRKRKTLEKLEKFETIETEEFEFS
jgi:hypothetical protein